jgi:rhodanese-related sulfurtransferase
MKKSISFLGLIVAVVLSVGLVSTSGCSTTAEYETPVIQPIPETPVTQSTPVTSTSQVTDKQEITTESQQDLLADIRSKAEEPSTGIYYINAVSAKKLFDVSLAIFVDARYLSDYEISHISGAISLPVSSVWKGDIEPDKILPNREAVLITYCASGCPASLELARELSNLGYTSIFVLNGGYPTWEDAGYPMDKRG